LSSYPNPLLKQYIKKYKWHVHQVKKSVAVTKLTNKQKIELLVFNYDEKKLNASNAPSKKLPSAQQLTNALKNLKFAA
jgi:hypothetical protein